MRGRRASGPGPSPGRLARLANGLGWALTLAIIVAALLLVGVRLLGFEAYAVLSGSMEPAYPTGSLIYVKPVPPETIREGDPITFVMNEDLVVATHRVVAVDTKNRSFTTKGDANEAADGSPVRFENLLGKPVFCIPLLGYVAAYVREPPGLYVAIAAVAIVLLLAFLPDSLGRARSPKHRSQSNSGLPINPSPAGEEKPKKGGKPQ